MVFRSMPAPDSSSKAQRRAASWSATGDDSSPIRSTRPAARDSPEAGSTSWYLSDDEPELITSTNESVMYALRLNCGDGHGVDDVLDQRTPGQVVHRLTQTLQHRTDRD